jgi:hypothetical protein
MNMTKVSWLQKLKQRWNIPSTFQIIIILVVFACTGFTVLFLKKPLLAWLSGSDDQSTLGTILYYIFILPFYNVLLLAYGFVFGQFDFFWQFEKRFFTRITSKFKKHK